MMMLNANLPSPAVDRGFPKAVSFDFVDAIIRWCEGVYSTAPLSDSLLELLKGLGAEAGLLVRTEPRRKPALVLCIDRQMKTTVAPVARSYADECFGPHIRFPKSGSVWIASSDAARAKDWDTGGELEAWQRKRNMNDFTVLVLSEAQGVRDQIELHFTRVLSEAERHLLCELGPMLARTWAMRKVGVVSAVRQSPARPEPTQARILATSNPARLSRAEFHICHLLGQGLTASEIADDLGRSEATIRSHLRSIYAKTGVHSLAQLTYRLMNAAPQDHLIHRSA